MTQTGHAWLPNPTWVTLGWHPPTLRKDKWWQGLLSMVRQNSLEALGSEAWSLQSQDTTFISISPSAFIILGFIKLLIICFNLQLMAEMLSLQFVFNHTTLAVFMQWSLQQFPSSIWCLASSEQSSALTKVFSKNQEFPQHLPSCAGRLTSLMTQFTQLPKGTVYLFE